MDDNIISFSDYLRRKQGRITIDKKFLDDLSADIKTKPELIEWFNFQSFFNKHKLFLHQLFTSNHQAGNSNPNAGYFISFTDELIKENTRKIIEANDWLDRSTILIDAKDCTFKNIASQLSDSVPKDTTEAWNMFNKTLLESNKVIVIANISKSKINPNKDKSQFVRSIIKINDDAHFNGIKPKSDILFVDSSHFLETSWNDIGSYINIFS